MTDTPGKVDVDREYERRWSWWAYLPEVEREQFSRSERQGDQKALVQLTKRGKRREKFHAYDTCARRPVVQGIAFPDDPEDDPACECLTKALDSDALIKFLERRKLAALDLAHVAQELHRDAEWSIEKWITGKRKQAKAKATLGSESIDTAPKPAVEDSSPAPAEKAVVNGAHLSPRPSRTRVLRWFDVDPRTRGYVGTKGIPGINELEDYIF